MASITISNLQPLGSELFSDSEGYMRDLADREYDYLYGGIPFAVWAIGYGIYHGARASSAWCAGGAVAGAAAIGGVIGWTNG